MTTIKINPLMQLLLLLAVAHGFFRRGHRGSGRGVFHRPRRHAGRNRRFVNQFDDVGQVHPPAPQPGQKTDVLQRRARVRRAVIGDKETFEHQAGLAEPNSPNQTLMIFECCVENFNFKFRNPHI